MEEDVLAEFCSRFFRPHESGKQLRNAVVKKLINLTAKNPFRTSRVILKQYSSQFRSADHIVISGRFFMKEYHQYISL